MWDQPHFPQKHSKAQEAYISFLWDQPYALDIQGAVANPRYGPAELLRSPSPSSMPSWPLSAEELIQEWIQAYHDAVDQVRHATNCTSLIFIGQGPPALIDKFMSLAERRYPCVTIPSGEGQFCIYLTGDPKTVHEHVASKVADAIRGCNLHLWAEMETHYGFAASPEWQVWVRQPGRIGTRDFDIGWAKKEPDFSTWRFDSDGDGDFVMEIAYNNETRAELLWECRLWSQQGHGAAPVVRARNVIGIKIEKGVTYRQDRNHPAMAILLFEAADELGHGIHSILAFNANASYLDVWEQETGLRPILSNQVEIPFSFMLRLPPAEWRTITLLLTFEFLAGVFASGEAKDISEENAAAVMM
ncbi:unnamed protein product [Sympodiomycopsis kandeliae]